MLNPFVAAAQFNWLYIQSLLPCEKLEKEWGVFLTQKVLSFSKSMDGKCRDWYLCPREREGRRRSRGSSGWGNQFCPRYPLPSYNASVKTWSSPLLTGRCPTTDSAFLQEIFISGGRWNSLASKLESYREIQSIRERVLNKVRYGRFFLQKFAVRLKTSHHPFEATTSSFICLRLRLSDRILGITSSVVCKASCRNPS